MKNKKLLVNRILSIALSFIMMFVLYYKSQSVVRLVLFAMLGISTHGQRIISKNFNDKIALRKAFWSLYFLHSVFSVFSVLIYIAFSILFGGDDKTIYLIQVFYVLSALFDITWFFYGLENFKSVVIKNTLVRVVECVLVFVLVKTKYDLWIYTLISSLGIFLGQLVLIPQAIRIAKPIRFSGADVSKHIKPLFLFFIAALASNLFTVFDKTLLGLMVSKEAVAYYEYSNKIISIPKVIIIVAGTVMLPRACKLANAGDVIGQKRYMNYSFMFASFIGMGSLFGLLAVAPLFAKIYFGADFEVCGPIMMALSPVIYTVGAGDVIRTQYMVPNHKEKELTISIVLSAIINIILSFALIPVLGIYGAVVGSVCAELFEFVFQIVVCRSFISAKDVLFPLLPFLVIGLLMYGILKALSILLGEGVIDLIVLVSTGAAFFSILSFLYLLLFKKDMLKLFFKKGSQNLQAGNGDDGRNENQ